jgi:TonB-linked SusC/RagA family outer membrane protein
MKKIFTEFSVFTCVLFLLLSEVVHAQNITIKGVVNDDQNLPIPGVSIVVKGTSNGTQTDTNGSFSLNAPSNATLVFSFIGFDSQEIAVAGRNNINVNLKTQRNDLQQVVVIGYGTQRKRDLTGSITSVKGEDIAKSPNLNPVSSLQGKVAGLTIVNSGTPGEAPTVRIRGNNSTNAASPVYVVDGVIQTNIDYLNAMDIESMEILKDPSSTAIFGVQGGNGVIVITTKRAAQGTTRVSFQTSAGIQRVINTIDVTDAEGFKKLYSAQLANLNAAPFDYTNYTANTDWQKEAIKTAPIYNNSLNISNTGEKSTTLLSLGYSHQSGVLANSSFKKFTGRLSHDIKITDNIKVGGDINGFYYDVDPAEVSLNNLLWSAPIVPIKLDDNTYYSMPTFQRAQVGNPIATLNRLDKTSITKGYRAVASIFGEVKFLKDFKLRSVFYTDLGFNSSRNYTPLPFNFINLGEGATPTSTTFDNTVRTGIGQNENQSRKFQQDHTLTFDKTINDHKVTALAGFSTLYTSGTALSASRRDTTLNVPRVEDLWYLNLINASMPNSVSGSGGESAQMSTFARINYSYKDRYLINATLRGDGISKFAPENRWGVFGSVGLGWVASEEDFFKNNVKGIDFLKFKASWGTLGNAQGFRENIYLSGLQNAGTAIFGDRVYTSVEPAYIPDPNLHWEVVRGLDLGFELRAFDSKFTSDITYYNRTTKDILTRLQVGSSNLPLLTNLGNISNKGIEVALSWNDKIGDFRYGISPNFSYNKNNVESIGNDFNFQIVGNGGTHLTTTGYPIGYFYGYRQTGVYQSTADLDRIPAMSNSLPGDISYADTNGDGVITPADRTYLGNSMPEYNYGINVSLGYKNFDLLLEGQGVAGNHIYVQRRTNRFATLNYEANRINAWTGPGTTNIEPILDNTRANNYEMSSYYLEPGDYFRLRTIQLGYNFGKQLIGKWKMQQLRLYVSGQNLHTWSKTTGYSPEVTLNSPIAGGIDNGVYPIPAVYTFGLNVTF